MERGVDANCPRASRIILGDVVIPAAFSGHVRKWLPSAEQVTIDCCGHVPQVECPEETNELLLSFFERADAAQPPAPVAAARTRSEEAA